MQWKWLTGTLKYSAKCARCKHSLREMSGSGVVEWCDGKTYHTHCLLDELAEKAKQPEFPLHGFS